MWYVYQKITNVGDYSMIDFFHKTIFQKSENLATEKHIFLRGEKNLPPLGDKGLITFFPNCLEKTFILTVPN